MFSPASRMPLPFASAYALIVQPPRPGSPASFTPSPFRSLNFVPVFVAFWKLPKLLSASVWFEVRVMPQPPADAPHAVFAGKDWIHVACWTSHTM